MGKDPLPQDVVRLADAADVAGGGVADGGATSV